MWLTYFSGRTQFPSFEERAMHKQAWLVSIFAAGCLIGAGLVNGCSNSSTTVTEDGGTDTSTSTDTGTTDTGTGADTGADGEAGSTEDGGDAGEAGSSEDGGDAGEAGSSEDGGDAGADAHD